MPTVEIQTYHDHRMAMSLALAGLRIPGVVILDPGCTAKTYPAYFDDLARLCPTLEHSPRHSSLRMKVCESTLSV